MIIDCAWKRWMKLSETWTGLVLLTPELFGTNFVSDTRSDDSCFEEFHRGCRFRRYCEEGAAQWSGFVENPAWLADPVCPPWIRHFMGRVAFRQGCKGESC